MSSEPARESHRARRAFSCLIKGPLGCLAFGLGSAAVFLLLFPPVGGRLADRWVEQWFAERHAGRLEMGDAWMGSLFGSQTIERLILRDPAGEEVLRGTLTAPPLSWILEGRRPYGPIELHIENMRIAVGADGATNLDRALALAPDPPSRPRSDRLRTDVPLEATVRIRVERLRLDGPGTATETLQGLSFEGLFEWNPELMRLTLSGGESEQQWAAFGLDLEVQRMALGDPHPSGKWTLVNAPAALVGVGVRPVGQLAALAGARLDRVEVVRREAELELHVRDEGIDLTVLARYQVDPPALIGAGLREGIDLEVEGQDLLILRPFLPFVAGLEAPRARARLADFLWSLGPSPADVSGDLRLELAATAYQLGGGLPLPMSGPDLQPVPGRLDRSLTLEHGRLLFQGVTLPLQDGELLLDGRADLLGPGFAFRAQAEVGGQRVDLGEIDGPAPVEAPRSPRAPEPARPEQGPAAVPE